MPTILPQLSSCFRIYRLSPGPEYAYLFFLDKSFFLIYYQKQLTILIIPDYQRYHKRRQGDAEKEWKDACVFTHDQGHELLQGRIDHQRR